MKCEHWSKSTALQLTKYCTQTVATISKEIFLKYNLNCVANSPALTSLTCYLENRPIGFLGGIVLLLFVCNRGGNMNFGNCSVMTTVLWQTFPLFWAFGSQSICNDCPEHSSKLIIFNVLFIITGKTDIMLTGHFSNRSMIIIRQVVI